MKTKNNSTRIGNLRKVYKSLIICLIFSFSIQSYSTNYYVSNYGNDKKNGTSTSTPWKTINKVNSKVFSAGDQILFQNGGTFYGGLVLKGNGNSSQRITVGAYDGYTLKPKIEGQGNVVDAILLENYSYWTIKDLEVTNYGATRGQYRSGVTLRSTAGSVVSNVTVENLTIHNTNSMLDKGNEGSGIYIDANYTNSNFDNVIIENNYIFFVDRNGISQRTVGGAKRSTNMIIRNNRLENIGGDCIKLWGSNGGLIERNTVKGGMIRAVDASAGIWPFDCDSTLIQYNEVSGMKRCIDGQAFDSDYMTTNSVFQYNYSHDNEGGFFLLCAPDNETSNGAIVRYNISQNDGIAAANYPYPGTGFTEGAVFTFGGHVTNSKIYNNLIYIKPGLNVQLIRSGSWGSGSPSSNNFSNNIFYVDGSVSYSFSAGETPTFNNNVYYGNHTNRPTDNSAITAKPNLVSVNSGGDGFNTLDGYKFSSLNYAFLGKSITNNGGKDFWGNSVSQTYSPLVGAHDIPTDTINAGDVTPPTAPTNLVAYNSTNTDITLSWSFATDNVGVAQYEVYANGIWKATLAPSVYTYTFTGLVNNATYSFTVIAKDAAGNYTVSSPLNATIKDITAPTAPTNLVATSITSNSFVLSWTGSWDNVGILQYEVYRNGVWYGNSTSLSYPIAGLAANTTYTIDVIAKDVNNNWTLSSPIYVKTAGASYVKSIATEVNSTEKTEVNIFADRNSCNLVIENLNMQVTVFVMSIEGKVVLKTKTNTNSSEINIPLTGLSKGVYLVSVQSEGAILATKKLFYKDL